MFWVYGYYKYFNSFSAGTVFASIAVRFERLEMVPVLKGLSMPAVLYFCKIFCFNFFLYLADMAETMAALEEWCTDDVDSSIKSKYNRAFNKLQELQEFEDNLVSHSIKESLI